MQKRRYVALFAVVTLLSACNDKESQLAQCKLEATREYNGQLNITQQRDYIISCMQAKGYKANGFCKIPGDPVSFAECYDS